MTIVSESFDSYNGVTAPLGLRARWIGSSSNAGALVTGRFSGQALSIGGIGTETFRLPLGYSSGEFSLSVARFWTGSGPDLSENTFSMGLLNSGSSTTTPQLSMHRDANRNLAFAVGGTTGALGTNVGTTTGNLLVPEVWHTIQIRGNIGAGSTGNLYVRINGVDVLSLPGIDTHSAGSETYDSIILGRNGVSQLGQYFDDIVIKDDDSAFLPECRIQSFAPNADGSTLDFTQSTGATHFGVVDERPVSSTDYLSAATVGNLDLLGVEDLATIPGSILAVKHLGFAAKTDVATRAWNLGIESGGTVSNGSDLALTSTAQYYERTHETDPDTGVAWDQAGFNAHQLQPRVAV